MKIKGITRIEYFTKGKRGILYTGFYKHKKVVIKAKLPESMAEGRIENEGRWLKILNKYKIGPKLIKSTKDYFFYEYVPGEFFIDFVEKLDRNKESKKKILDIIKDVLEQCFVLDQLKVDKEEMHHPIKHIIITKKLKPIMIDAGKSKISSIQKTPDVVLLDFERCHNVENGKNVTQFSVFLIRLKELLLEYGIKIEQDKMIELLKIYKREQTKNNFNKIINKIA
jgi:predicted Ser/Thr protein kinase